MIMVGPYDQLAVVRGKVKRNRIFELRKGETLKQLLDMAGGFTGDAYTKDVQVKRKSDSRYQISTVSEDKFASFVMQDGDSLQVDSVIPFYENRLVVTGAVWRPGEYELSPSVRTVKQLVKQAAGLKGVRRPCLDYPFESGFHDYDDRRGYSWYLERYRSRCGVASGRPIKHSFPIRFARTLYDQGWRSRELSGYGASVSS